MHATANVRNFDKFCSAQVETEFRVEPPLVDYNSVTKSDFSKGHLGRDVFQYCRKLNVPCFIVRKWPRIFIYKISSFRYRRI